MDLKQLRARLNKSVRLTFRDGEEVEATLLGIDETRDRDLTYEVTRIIRAGVPTPRGTRVGATCIAKLDELHTWSPV